METSGPHRLAYNARLDQLGPELAELASDVRDIVTGATAAVTGPRAGHEDTAHLYAARRKLKDRSDQLDETLVELLVREAPVAGDLRRVVAGLRILSNLERMADLAVHVAEAADRRAPAAVVPTQLRPTIARLGDLCCELVGLLVTALASTDLPLIRQVEEADEPIDETHRQLLAALTDPAGEHGIETAVDLALISRYYERFADQAVTAARQLAGLNPR